MKKRILPALLALCMVMSLLPVAFAGENDTQTAAKCACAATGCKSTNKDAQGKCQANAATGSTFCETCKACTQPTTGGDETPETPATCKCPGYAAGDLSEGATPCNHKDGCKETTLNEDGLCTNCAKNYKDFKKTVVISCECTDHKTSEKPAGCPGKVTLTDEEKETKRLKTVEKCDACLASTTCNKCTTDGCTLLNDHDGPHNNKTCDGKNATEAGKKGACGASEHKTGCGAMCDLAGNACTYDSEKGIWTQASDNGVKCTLTEGHLAKGIPHNNSQCIANTGCGAATHCPGQAEVKAAPAEGEEGTPGYKPAVEPVAAVPACPMSSKTAAKCGLGGCTLPANHTGEHNNTKCLGTNDDGRCQTTLPNEGKHITGCKKFNCGCDADDAHSDTEFNKGPGKGLTCTHKAGCPLCAAWNAYVAAEKGKYNTAKAAYDQYVKDQKAYDEAKKADPNQTAVKKPTVVEEPEKLAAKITPCTCKACDPTPVPGMGAVVDAEGNEVDPAEPTETPTKVEDFKDADKMDDWMKDAVQTMLDEGWMEGTGDSFEPREEANTNVVLTVIARMSGETITGATWADDAKAWAEENELTEGIEITKSDIARKDIVLMLWRLAGKPDSTFELTFTDVDGLEGDYLTAMKWAAENKIVVGNGDDTVTPDGTLKRAELAVLAARYAALKK